MIIIISGPPGSGKTSVASRLASQISFKFISAGSIFREIAKSMKLDIIDLNRLAEINFDIDKMVDNKIYEHITKEKNLVIESHIAGWLFREYADIAVYLWASLKTRASRIAARDRISYDEAVSQIIKREYMHYRRFKKYYGIDINDLSVYDLVINTSYLTVDEIVKIILLYFSSVVSAKSDLLKKENTNDNVWPV